MEKGDEARRGDDPGSDPDARRRAGPDGMATAKRIAGSDALAASKPIAGPDAMAAARRIAGLDAMAAARRIAGPDAMAAAKRRSGPEALEADPFSGQKRPRRSMARPLTFLQWLRREDASLRKSSIRMKERFPDFNSEEEYASSGSKELSGWESTSDDGAVDSLPDSVPELVPPIGPVPPLIEQAKVEKLGSKVVVQEGEGAVSKKKTERKDDGWVTVRKYDAGATQRRRPFGK